MARWRERQRLLREAASLQNEADSRARRLEQRTLEIQAQFRSPELVPESAKESITREVQAELSAITELLGRANVLLSRANPHMMEDRRDGNE